MLQISTAPTHDVTFTIDDEPVRGHIARLSKADVIEFRREFIRVGTPRGTETLTDEQKDALENRARSFIDASITAYVSFEPGDVVIDEKPVVTGADIVEAFYNRDDVLAACYQAIYAENCLGAAQKKILNSRRIFSPGSTPSTKTPAGAAPGSTAASADGSTTAADGTVTASPNGRPSGGQIH